MKVVAFNGSPRKEGNTARLLNIVSEELEREDIQTELVQLGGKKIKGCIACMRCFELKNGKCHNDSDIVNESIDKMVQADGIVLGSPTYFANVSTEIKALIDRAGLVAIANDYSLKRKIGAAVVAVRRGGALPTFDAMNHFFQINQVVVATSVYWNLGIGLHPGEVDSDQEGVHTMKTLGENMAWLMKKVAQ